MRSILLTLTLLSSISLFAQKIKLTEGSLDALKGQKEISIQYTYDAVMVGTDQDEKVFLERKKAEWDTKEAGRGDAFEKQWFESRKALYEAIFAFRFDKTSSLTVAKTPAQYTLIVKTKRIEPGWNAGVVQKAPTVEGQAWVVSTSDPSKVLAIITFEKCNGEDTLGGDFEMGRRIQSAYHTAATEIAKFIEKKL